MKKASFNLDTVIALLALTLSLVGLYFQYIRVDRSLSVSIVSSEFVGPVDGSAGYVYRARILFANYGQRDEVIVGWSMVALGDQMGSCIFGSNDVPEVLKPNSVKLIEIIPDWDSMKNCNLHFNNISGKLFVGYIDVSGMTRARNISFSGLFDEVTYDGKISFAEGQNDKQPVQLD